LATGADDAQLPRHCRDAQRAVVRQDQLFVELGTRQLARVGAGREDDLLGEQGLFGSAGDLDFIAAILGSDERAATVEEADLVLLEQVQDAVVVLFHDGFLAAHHLGHVDLQIGQADAVLGKVVAGVLEVLARLQQRLRRDAAHVRASAARRRAA
jgi:hypothetical protein